MAQITESYIRAVDFEMSRYKNLLSAVDALITTVIEPDDELARMLRHIRMNQQSRMDITVAQTNKQNPVNVGDEYITPTDSLVSSFTPEEALRRTQAKKLAQRLYSMFHPDKNTEHSQDSWNGKRMFDVVREAANLGNILMLNFISLKYSRGDLVSDEDKEKLLDLARARSEKLSGVPIVRCARMHLSGSPDTKERTKRVLSELLVKTLVTQVD